MQPNSAFLFWCHRREKTMMITVNFDLLLFFFCFDRPADWAVCWYVVVVFWIVYCIVGLSIWSGGQWLEGVVGAWLRRCPSHLSVDYSVRPRIHACTHETHACVLSFCWPANGATHTIRLHIHTDILIDRPTSNDDYPFAFHSRAGFYFYFFLLYFQFTQM